MPEYETTALEDDVYVLPSQHALWIEQKLAPPAACAAVGSLHLIEGPLDEARLAAALAAAVAEADGLHMHLFVQQHRLRQQARDGSAAPLGILDLAATPDPMAAALAWFAQTLRQPIGPEADPPCRFALLRLGPERRVFAQVFNHLVIDRRSGRILIDRIHAHMGDQAAPAPATFAACAHQFALASSGPAGERATRHWRHRLGALPPLLWPGAERATGREAVSRMVADAPAVLAAAQRLGTSVARLILACLARAICRTSGREAVTIGHEVDLRGGARFAQTIGCLAAPLPLAIRAPRAVPLAAVLRDIGTTLDADYRHARFAIHRLNIRGGNRALFDVTYNFLPLGPNGPWPEIAVNHGGTTPLLVSVSPTGPGIRLQLDYTPGLVDAAGLLETILMELDTAIAAPDAAATPWPLLSDVDAPPRALLATCAALAAARVLDRDAVSIAIAGQDSPRTLHFEGQPRMSLGAAIQAVAIALAEPATPPDETAPAVTLLWPAGNGTPSLAFPPGTPLALVRGITEAFEVLQADIPASLATPLAALRILPLQRAAELLARARGAVSPLPEPASIPALVAAQALRTPEAIALADAAEAISYRTMMDRVETLAGVLAQAGAGPGGIVALMVSRGIAMVIALLAVQRAGAAFLPIDPAFPAERIDFMLRDAAAVLAIADGPTTPGIAVLRLDQPLPPAPRAPAACMAGPGDLAYVLYTSGSTGQPKAVAVEQRSIANLAVWGAATIGPAGRGMLFSTALVFDVAMFELFSPLVSGGRLLVADGLPALIRSPLREEVRIVSGSPTVLDAVARGGGLPSGVEIIVSAGEALTRDLADRLLAARPGVRLINAYGPTEATVYASVAEIAPSGGAPSIGRAIANMTLHVLDRAGHLVPDGAEGELCLGGAGVARGYLNRPELSAERFIPNPYGPGQLYRTGDRARWRTDGQIDYLGRADSQLKLHGVRIEAGEVEAALRRLPCVAAAVVDLRGSGAQKRLVAWIVAEGPAPDGATLRQGLAALLPRAMIPGAFVLLDHLPVTVSGKTDRAALPSPADGIEPASTAAPPRRAPQTDAERAIFALWRNVLELPCIRDGAFGVDDDLFALGADSLAAVLVCTEIEATYGLRVPHDLIAGRLTVARLAAFIAAPKATDGLHVLVDGQPIEPTKSGPRAYDFALTLPAREIRILSRSAVPLELGTAADPRRLGAQIVEITWQQDGRQETVPLAAPLLGEGFHPFEPAARARWTDGDAWLAGDLIPQWTGPARLTIRAWTWLDGRATAQAPEGEGWLARFESLGTSCEFGFVQKHFDVRVPLGLLRWAATDHHRLRAGLEDGFAALTQPDGIEVVPSDPDYRLRTPYAELHTFQSMTVSGPDSHAIMHRRGVAAVAHLRRKLLADIADGHKIFVFTSPSPEVDETVMRGLRTAMNRHGTAPLLCVTLAPPGTPPGPVHMIAPGLYAATISSFVLGRGPYDEWRAICKEMLELVMSASAIG